MISKELFCETIKMCEDRDHKMSNVSEAFAACFPGHASAFAEIADAAHCPYEKQIAKLLEDAVDDENGWVRYFFYDLEFGKAWTRDTVVDEDGSDIELRTPEQLYDFLTE